MSSLQIATSPQVSRSFSCHGFHCKKGKLYSQALCLNCICSNSEYFDEKFIQERRCNFKLEPVTENFLETLFWIKKNNQKNIQKQPLIQPLKQLLRITQYIEIRKKCKRTTRYSCL